MARIPAIPEETALTASNVESPELLVALGRAADRAFENDIVPKELFDPFREPTLYVANRVELTPSVPATGSTSVEGDEPPIVTAPPANSRKYLYERQFDSLFWNKSQHVLFVVGDPGCGKSTFIKFYLYGYCPNRHRDNWTDPTDPVDPTRADEFKRKLTIHVDYQLRNEIGAIHQEFYRQARQTIAAKYRERIRELSPGQELSEAELNHGCPN